MTKLQQQAALAWKKSSASGLGDCVEVAEGLEAIHVRDSKDPAGPVLAFSASEWNAVLSDVRSDKLGF